MAPSGSPRRPRHPLFYLVDFYFLHIVALSFATPWLRSRIYAGDVQQPYFPGCVAQQVNMHWSYAKGRIGCAEDHPWEWLIEYVGNALGTDTPSAFLDGSDLFYGFLVLYAFGHVIYAIIRLTRLAFRRRRAANALKAQDDNRT